MTTPHRALSPTLSLSLSLSLGSTHASRQLNNHPHDHKPSTHFLSVLPAIPSEPQGAALESRGGVELSFRMGAAPCRGEPQAAALDSVSDSFLPPAGSAAQT